MSERPPERVVIRGVTPELNILLNVYLFEKALYEFGGARIPLAGILQLLQAPEAAA